MEDMDRKAKEAVLQQIMDLMDEREVGGMKSKSPKFMKMETEEPTLAEALKEKMMAVEDGPYSRDEVQEMDPAEDMKNDEMDDEDLERLKEMYARLK